MSRNIALFILATWVFFLLTNVSADEADKIKKIQEDVKKVSSSVYDNDVETTLFYTHKKIIEMMGGYEVAQKLTSEALAKFSGAGMKVESLEFPSSPQFFKSSLNEFVFVPTLTVISMNGQKIESLNFQLGIRELSSNAWKYVEGSRINKQNVNQFFPDFPVDIDFPPIYRKKL
ncbi:MAG TPA: hypothetical protein PKA63_12380 [Oligoflexia bacterium]|nr:hypothetical protein [Oligoflexia bacterium]HMP49453.1 hypothetical protein [Oligoflexia bacterium]